MNIKIKVSIPEFKAKLASFKDHHARLTKFMNNLETVIKAIAQVSWVSPASRALLTKLQALLQTVRTALKIVEKYISDLEAAIQQYNQVESRVTDKVNNLQTDVFNV